VVVTEAHYFIHMNSVLWVVHGWVDVSTQA